MALAIMSIGMLAMSTYFSNSNHQQQMLFQNMARYNVQSVLSSLVANQNQCTKNLTVAPVDLAQQPISLPNLQYFNSLGAAVGPAISIGPIPDGFGLSVASIQITNVSHAAPFTGDIIVNFSGVSPLPPPAEVQNVPFTTAGTIVQSCGITAQTTFWVSLPNPPGSVSCAGFSWCYPAATGITTASAYCQSLGYHDSTQNCQANWGGNTIQGVMMINNTGIPGNYAWGCVAGLPVVHTDPADTQIQCVN